MGDGVVGESTDPRWLDKAKLRSKVGTDHTQLHGGQNGDGKSSHGHGDTGEIPWEFHQGHDLFGQVHQSQSLVEFAIPHKRFMRHRWAAIGKGRYVYTVVSEGGQNEEGRLTQ
mmetsp:Transcript_13542/g.18883  ORF Transcript_13542/g.18883 Transcript_13542/m.18883 type:complete len:113 (-) Transcript_13542:1595-1933(-)